MVKVKSQNVWSQLVDICGNDEGKSGVVDSTPLAEIGLSLKGKMDNQVYTNSSFQLPYVGFSTKSIVQHQQTLVPISHL